MSPPNPCKCFSLSCPPCWGGQPSYFHLLVLAFICRSYLQQFEWLFISSFRPHPHLWIGIHLKKKSYFFSSICLFIQAGIYISIDPCILNYFILWVIIQCYRYFLAQSVSFFGHCQLFPVGSYVISTSPLPILPWALVYFYELKDAPDSFSIFPASALESATSSKKHCGFFH